VLRRAGVVVFVLALVLLLVAGCGYLYLRSSTLPREDGELSLEGLREPVRVDREPSGVPHIRAGNEHDLFFALGVVHAQDRLWQMEFQRRVGAGRLSEVLGPSTVEQDRFLRTVGFYRAAEEAYRSLSPRGRRSVHAYVAGINAYLDTDPGLPPEFRLLRYEPERWRPADVLVWVKMMSLDLSANYESELERYRLRARGLSEPRISELLPPYPEDAPTILSERDLEDAPRGVAAAGAERQAERLLAVRRSLPVSIEASNNWVVSGERTRSGRPLLANDPHLGLQVPSLWYLAHLESPTLEAIGATLPGLPGVVIGRNDRISWGVTNVGADVQDLYEMNETDDGTAYRYRGEELPYGVRNETIKVDGGRDVRLKVRETVYGPVVSDVVDAPEGGRPLALRWTSLDREDRTMEAFLGVDRAGGWGEFNRALRLYNAPAQNFVYADVEGNIGYVAPGRFPIRGRDHSGLYPVPGDGSRDWRGFVPFDDRPRTFNPERGFVVTANNKVTPPGYPYTLSLEWAQPYRAERIRQMIEAGGDDLTADDMVRIQQDQHSLLFRDFRPVLERLNLRSDEAREWRERLLTWDSDAGPSSREASVFAAWYAELTRLPAREVGQARWNNSRYLLQALENGDPNCGEGGTVEDCEDFAARAFERALGRLGDEVPAWGELHEATFEHPVLSTAPLAPLFDRSVPFGGDGSTVNVGPYELDSFRMNAGPSYRQVVDLSDGGRAPEGSRFVHPMGQSGNPLSANFDDLLPMWRDGRYLPMRTSGYEVDHRLTLRPR
jgi:penicillin amidase